MHYREMQFSTKIYVVNLRIVVIYRIPTMCCAILKSLFLEAFLSCCLLSSFQIQKPPVRFSEDWMGEVHFNLILFHFIM